MSSLPNSRWESRKRSDPTSGWFSTSVWSTPPGGGRWRRPSGELPRGRAAALPHRGGGGPSVGARPVGAGPGPAQAQCRGDLPPPVSRIRHRRGERRGAEGAPAGDGRVHPPPPPRGETEITDGGRGGGGHPVRRV